MIGVLLVTQKIDAGLIRNKEYSKALHMSLFGNMSWLAISLMGIAANVVLAKPELSFMYVTEGMIIFTSFRLGLLTTTLGLSMRKSMGNMLYPTYGHVSSSSTARPMAPVIDCTYATWTCCNIFGNIFNMVIFDRQSWPSRNQKHTSVNSGVSGIARKRQL